MNYKLALKKQQITSLAQNPSREMKAGREERRVGDRDKDKEMCACLVQNGLLITVQSTRNIDNSNNILNAS